jgi:hypothetical protein
VPCGICLVLTSSHVNASDHNLEHLYDTYERIRANNPVCRTFTTLQLLIVEVWVYIVFLSIERDEIASFGRETKLRVVQELQVPAHEAVL